MALMGDLSSDWMTACGWVADVKEGGYGEWLDVCMPSLRFGLKVYSDSAGG